jgi:hypothetical protein
MRASVQVLLAGILLLAAAFGQAAVVTSVGNPTEEEKKTVQIVLYPAAEPKPALKYQLLPPFLERRPGNAAVWWNRIPAERRSFFEEFSKEYDKGGKIDTWLNIPLGTPQEKEYREKELTKVIHLLKPGHLYSDMERAARFESCDWQLPIREGNVFAILLPDVQQSRTYARMLAAKAHLEIAEGRYDEAVRTFQTGYAEARHVAQGTFLVGSLVGVTIAGITSHEVQKFIQQPSAPNLYWALSSLPRPLVDFRPGGEVESSLFYLQFPELRDVDKKNLSADGWGKLLNSVVADLIRISDSQFVGKKDKTNPVTTVVSVLQGYPRAKRYLIEQGRSAAEVDAMPAAQVVLLYSVRLYDELIDEQFKWFFLPSSDVYEERLQGAMRTAQTSLAEREIIPFARVLEPVAWPAKGAEARCQWNIAMLRIFEAMRLYAAAHDGRWPDHLSDITEVPLPTNPVDGKAFVYERQRDKAIATSAQGPRGVPWRHEITLMQKKEK